MEWCFDSADEIYASNMHEELMAMLRAEGTPQSDYVSTEIIYGELISNVIRHARGKVRVTLKWEADFPTLTVEDEQQRFGAKMELPDDPFAESGRGMFIVKSLARDFHIGEAGTDGGTATAVLPIQRRKA